MSGDETFDVIVVGGGPAGSTAATLVRRRGHRVLQLERETFPRYQIGESLLPATVHGIANLLEVADEIADAGFTVKRGGTFRWGTSPTPWTFDFAVSRKMAGPTSFAYQVERMKFDQILLDNARKHGVDVREACRVDEVVDEDERIRGVRYTDAEGRQHTARATYVVDASGNASKLYRAVGARREYSPFFRNLALFTYYEHGKRLDPPNSGNILSVAFEHGWFWYIPLTPELTSVGAVVHQDSASLVQGDPEVAMQRFIDACPLISDMLHGAQRVTSGPYGQFRVRKDWSYCNTTFSAPGMLLIGDAACFVDPVFSSGVHLATYSGLLAARSINACLDGAVAEEPAFGEFERRYRNEYRLFHEFLVGFYDMEQSEESYFWQARKVSQTSSSDIEAFVELVGGVASADNEAVVATVKDRFVDATKGLSRMLADADADDSGLVVGAGSGELMQQSAALQARAVAGAESGEGRADEPGGLRASDDGLSWVPDAC